MDFFQILLVGCHVILARTFFEIKKERQMLLPIFHECFRFSLTWDPYETENFKALLLQTAAESFKTSPEFLLNIPRKKAPFRHLKCCVSYFSYFFSKISASQLYHMKKTNI